MASSDEPTVEAESGSSLLLNQPVVIDNGTATLKAGFAGSSKPKVRLYINLWDTGRGDGPRNRRFRIACL